MAPSSWAATHSVHHDAPVQRSARRHVASGPRVPDAIARRRSDAGLLHGGRPPRGRAGAAAERRRAVSVTPFSYARPCERRRGKSFAPRPPSDPAAVSSLQWRRGLQVADDGSAGHARQACADAVRSQLAQLLRYGLACAERSAARAWLAPRPETRVCVVPGLTSMCR